MYRSTHSLILTLGLSFSIADLAGCGTGDASKGSASGAGGATRPHQTGNGGTASASSTGSGAGGATASSSASSTSGQPSSSSTSASSSSGSTSSGSSSSSSSSSGSTKPPGTPQPGDVSVNPGVTHQVVDGFGQADVWQGSSSTQLQTLLFDPVNGIGLTLLRIGIESASGTSVLMGNAAIADSQACVKYAGSACKVWAAPWSPPASMKQNNNVNGNNANACTTTSNDRLDTGDYSAWASLLAAFPAYSNNRAACSSTPSRPRTSRTGTRTTKRAATPRPRW